MDIGRRDLFFSGAAAIVASNRFVRAGPARPLGYAIVGLGSYGLDAVIPQFLNCEHSRLAAVVSGNPAKAQRVAAEYGIEVGSVYSYETFDTIRHNLNVDVVHICLPNSMHAEYTVRAAHAGKHVICARPMAVSVAECRRMIAACKVASRKLMIGYRYPFEPLNVAAMPLAQTGATGTIRYIRSEHGIVQQDPSVWRLNRVLAGGGSLMDMGSYSLEAARCVTSGEPIAVTARMSTDRRDPRFAQVEDIVDWTLEFPSGVIASCRSTYSASKNHLLLLGDNDSIKMQQATARDGNSIGLGRHGPGRAITPLSGPGKTRSTEQLEGFARCVRTGAEPIMSGEAGLRDMRVIAAIYQSAHEGRTIRLDSTI